MHIYFQHMQSKVELPLEIATNRNFEEIEDAILQLAQDHAVEVRNDFNKFWNLCDAIKFANKDARNAT